MIETRSTCPYCGVGCGVIIESDGAQITGVRGDPQHPANFGRLCSKGSTLHLTASAQVNAQVRLLQPLQRFERGQAPQPVAWSGALDTVATRLADTVRTHGPDAVGVYVSGQLLTEDYYVFNKLTKGLLGTNNIDTNSRLCMSSAVAGYKQTLGADAPPACYDDLQHASTLFIVGANPAFAHPVLFRRVEDAKRANPDLKIIVCDVRRTDTAELADLFLPIQPGTDVALFHGMLSTMLWEGWVDSAFIAAHTEGFEALKATVRPYTPELVAQLCGITPAQLHQASRWFAGVQDDGSRRPSLSLYCQGLNQSSAGTDKNAALICLHLATGQIGKPGTGPFSLTGQPNAMGGREVGGLANLLSAHRDLANPQHRAEVAALWGVDRVPERPGKTAVEMFQAAADGEIKALWIACTNPLHSLPDTSTVRRALERAEFVVLQDAFATTATAAYADVLLPATTWGEKEGTVTNSERRISRVRAAVPPPGPLDNGPRHDWRIAVDVGQRLERLLASPASSGTLFPYDSPESVWNEHRESTRGRDLDITGLSYAQLEQAPAQWPQPEGAAQGKARLYEDGVFPTSTGRARFVAADYRPVAEPRDARYPLALTTGRLRDQWHGMSRTGTLGRLFGHVREPVLSLHPQDMAVRGLTDGDIVSVRSRRGSLYIPVQASSDLLPTQAFVPMHWGPELLGGQDAQGAPATGVNSLTNPAYCPSSKQPEFKHSAIAVDKAVLPWGLVAMAWMPAEQALQIRSALGALLGGFRYAACGVFAGDDATQTGVWLRAAHETAVADEIVLRVEALMRLDGLATARYADARTGQRRSVRTRPQGADTVLAAFALAGDTRSQAWVAALLEQTGAVQALGRSLLAATSQPPLPMAAPAKVVCACFGVTEDAIQRGLEAASGDAAQRLGAVQQQLKCGTNCGSCVPQLQRMARLVAQPVAAT
ncbi:molybdopterin-dependent oxidoreductase [Curvibacter sp. APW13]|uniref:nitrate reductase n=1 Tax=Curvibacter sp. APW13 TaxID=3077236 RepID=UPI0028DEA0A3|nr:molybdopterin-dependent oxidoreductase [Curvibacter sp. APW13]MDT8990779.1 molybdopterin-dependent oxidoreductase [Curvibacter sp. APW13]